MNIKVLTDEQIIRILEENRPEYDGLDKAIAVSRAIEQAVLQSEQVQAWRRDAERYRKVRHMTLCEISDLYEASVKTGAPFDLLVDISLDKQI